ncbi:MAG: hypothetical protein ACK518_03165 [bacterium]
MPKKSENIDDILETLYVSTDSKISAIERILYGIILEYLVDNLEIKEDKIKFTKKNVNTLQNLNSVDSKISSALEKLGTYIIKGILSLFSKTVDALSVFDTRAVESSDDVKKTITKHATENVGINNNLSAVYSEIKQESIALMSRYEGVSLQELRQYLQEKIKDKRIVNKYFNRWTGDIYSQYQRAAANEVRKKIGLKYAIYQGGLIETSRKFCIDRNNKVFSEDEIKSWVDLDFNGKPVTGYDPIIDCGGYNCRHRLDWVSDSFAKLYKKRQGV